MGEEPKIKMNISVIRQKLYILNKQRTKHIFRLVHGKPMVLGLPHNVFRKCGKSNCKCAKGERHGPYPALSVNKDGKQKIVMIKKADVAFVLEEANRYKYYQETLAKIRRINKEIDELLGQIKLSTIRSYP
ncbi:MAG TPA: hypothetical protein ENG87_05170 [Candidatus Pacearchaeota archaeon]|nr:hypothetical protein [Candidatus Pacearchaeota archaeon]